MNIFLTGGTGFIGSHFINQALSAGYNVYAIRRKSSLPRIKLQRQPTWIDGGLSGDYRDVYKKCNVFVHLAAHSANVPYDTLENCMHWNVTMPLKMINQAYDSGIENFLMAGSSFEYGISGLNYKFIPPEAPLMPTQTYPTSKAVASIAFTGWARIMKAKLKYLRIFQVFGEGEAEGRLWPSLRKAALAGKDFALTEGEQVRDFIPVEEVARRFLKELDFNNEKAGMPVVDNIGTGKPQKIKDFATYWWQKWNAQGQLHFGKIPYRENEVMRYVPEIKSKQFLYETR